MKVEDMNVIKLNFKKYEYNLLLLFVQKKITFKVN